MIYYMRTYFTYERNNSMNQAHTLMIKTNHYLIKGGELTNDHKSTITNKLLAAKSTPEQAKRRFKFTGRERDMYPYLYVLPHGQKLVTIFNQNPKTQILSMNNYELEILRLLNLFAPNNPNVQDMTNQAHRRLKNTCFGNRGCGTGECYDAGLVSLRFISATAPTNEFWLSNLVNSYIMHAGKRKSSKYYGRDYTRYYTWYYWLCLSELPYEIAEREIIRQKDEMISAIKQGLAMNTEDDKILSPVKLSAVKNCISRLPGYESIKNSRLFTNDNNNRLYIEMSDAL